MIPGGTSNCFVNGSQGLQMYGMTAEGSVSSSLGGNSVLEAHSCSLVYSFSILKDKVHQVQSLISIFVPPNQGQPESMAMAVAGMGNLIQEVIAAASSMMYNCQQMGYGAAPGNSGTNHGLPQQGVELSDGRVCGNTGVVQMGEERGQGFYSSDQSLDWYGDNHNNSNTNDHSRTIIVSNNEKVESRELPRGSTQMNEGLGGVLPKTFDIVELDAEDLLAKYTHYCQICGKGFKRDANLRMHMRAHGDEYKSNAALSNPMKNNGSEMENKDDLIKLPRKYSCPQEGCRWNRKHAKFQPLKSMICVKNHYKRSHCPKMYICKRCNQKQFSVLSDLRTHEKHCGDLKWLCSCGTTFSRKDKLMGHVALFVGHTPAINSLSKPVKFHQNASRLQ
ncbi:hypothetical protein PVL29_008097 [Vitis rotundifolia]|uniref:C2H2-type domain-containing protein n=1 Tax=Vitis rotundifolia TaxID=103349 RepID=A0AA39A1W9_VITRO|nr:hypothetical protein PVL29_008097 [Vitis rotundifolia]